MLCIALSVAKGESKCQSKGEKGFSVGTAGLAAFAACQAAAVSLD